MEWQIGALNKHLDLKYTNQEPRTIDVLIMYCLGIDGELSRYCFCQNFSFIKTKKGWISEFESLLSRQRTSHARRRLNKGQIERKNEDRKFDFVVFCRLFVCCSALLRYVEVTSYLCRQLPVKKNNERRTYLFIVCICNFHKIYRSWEQSSARRVCRCDKVHRRIRRSRQARYGATRYSVSSCKYIRSIKVICFNVC